MLLGTIRRVPEWRSKCRPLLRCHRGNGGASIDTPRSAEAAIHELCAMRLLGGSVRGLLLGAISFTVQSRIAARKWFWYLAF